MSAAANRWKLWEISALALALAAAIVWREHHFFDYIARLTERLQEQPPSRFFQSTDEYFLIQGYHRSPDLWRDGLSWWHGPWIHPATPYFRPIGSYIHWMHCSVGLRWGFVWLGYLGLVLFYAGCLLATALAWRFTRSKRFTVVGAAVMPFVRDFNIPQPVGWPAWFPGHPDLIVGSLLIGAVICFDLWIERARRRYLLGAWLLFLLACGIKEHAYIFPAMALALALLRHGAVEKRRAAVQVVFLFAAVALLLVYRRAVVPHALAPGFDPAAFALRPLYFLHPVFYAPLRLGYTAVLQLALLLWLQGWAWLRLRRTASVRRWLSRPFATTIVLFGMLAVAAGWGLLTDTLLLFADPLVAAQILSTVLQIWFMLYTLLLFIRYRREYPTALSYLLLWLTYVPVVHTNGWHYMLIGWLFRAQYWAVVAQVIWADRELDHVWRRIASFPHVSRAGEA